MFLFYRYYHYHYTLLFSMITLRKYDLKHVNDLSVNNGVLCLEKFIDSKQAKRLKQ